MAKKQCAVCNDPFEAKGSSNTCSDKCRHTLKCQRKREYRALPETKERRRERRASPERREQQSEYRNRPEIKAHIRTYMAGYNSLPENKERERARKVEYYYLQENKDRNRIRASNRRAREKDLPNTFTIEQKQQALHYFNGHCAVCSSPLAGPSGEESVHLDHWIPLSYEGNDNPGTVVENIVPLCASCNLSKHASIPHDWLNKIYGTQAKSIESNITKYFRSLTN